VSPVKTAQPIEMPFGKWTRVDPRDYVLDEGQCPPQEGTLFSILSTNVPIFRLQKRSSVTLNFPNEKSTCYAASRQNSLTTCYHFTVTVTDGENSDDHLKDESTVTQN